MKPTIFLLFLTLTPFEGNEMEGILNKNYTKDPVRIVARRGKSPSQKVLGVIESKETIIIFNIIFRKEFVNLIM